MLCRSFVALRPGVVFIVLSLTGSTVYALSGKPPRPTPRNSSPTARPLTTTTPTANDAHNNNSESDDDDDDDIEAATKLVEYSGSDSNNNNNHNNNNNNNNNIGHSNAIAGDVSSSPGIDHPTPRVRSV